MILLLHTLPASLNYNITLAFMLSCVSIQIVTGIFLKMFYVILGGHPVGWPRSIFSYQFSIRTVCGEYLFFLFVIILISISVVLFY